MSANPITSYFFLVAIVAMAVVVAATPLVIRLAERLGAVDDPGGRRVHGSATPRLGGLAIALGGLAGMLVVLGVPGIAIVGHLPLAITFAATCGILCLGFYDDVHQVPAMTKLLMQTVLALMCWAGGVRANTLGIPGLHFLGLSSPLSLLITVGWIVGVTNAINLLDGLDGLAAGVVAIVSATLVLVGVTSGGVSLLLIFTTGALCASCLGFLFYNSHPAKIFMGDTGSLFLGFLLANISILTFQKSTTATALGIPLLALGVPIADTVIAFTRRVVNGRSPFVADRHHLHHVLHRIGVSQRFAVAVIHGGTGLLCVFALLSVMVDSRAIYLGGAALLGGLVWLYRLMTRHGIKLSHTQHEAETPDVVELNGEVEAAPKLVKAAQIGD
ncbi:undecaprenyl/decaprenyl-phosphate alpha-N-acetylglucosaminyl 1-phosphate transferase [Candidatus Sumerlaeota bacterium]|nr:undecaprenyl/decaprenyl-phosphate alpha-N-acetylglucosaminyl 1-phosphate transferase [Candidatus Sumerlaeota bacterium]